jgi:3-hydroxyisobutyrate dehydrogenase-like beta-hydroxyacid dehydrogenase
VFKLINNLMGAVQIASLAEGVAIAEQVGLDMNLVAEALSTGAVASPQVIRHSKRMAGRDFSGASFTAALRHKDAVYAVRLAETLLPAVPVSRAAVEAYARAKAEMPDEDEGRMIEIVSRPK